MATRKPGRPSFKPTAAMRDKVAIAVGGGMKHEDIAEALGISAPTLRKHFDAELSRVAHTKRLEALVALQRSAKKGNVSAIRAYLNLVPTVTASGDLPGEPAETPAGGPAATPAAPGPVSATPVATVPIGKKEAAQAAAFTAQHGTEWDGLLPKITAVQH
mgnify:CR=1 FL=1